MLKVCQSMLKVRYNCYECKKEFTQKGSLSRHLLSIHGIDNRKFTKKKSKKPTKNIDNNRDTNTEITHFSTEIPQFSTKMSKIKSITCEFCLKTFSRVDSLNRHLKYCKEKIKSEHDFNKIKEELEQSKKIISDLSKTTSNQSKVIKHGIKYIKSNFTNAPPLTTDKNSIKMIEGYSDKIEKTISMLLYKYNHKQLDYYIRDIIVKIYIKEDKKMQSIWSTEIFNKRQI